VEIDEHRLLYNQGGVFVDCYIGMEFRNGKIPGAGRGKRYEQQKQDKDDIYNKEFCAPFFAKK
jgi:hypothetical protein